MPLLDAVALAPADPILGLTEAFMNDERANKVNLGVGVYLDDQGAVPLLRCIREAGHRILAEPRAHSYLAISGLASYIEAVRSLVFGAGTWERIASVQALGGTGALKVGADFLRAALPEAEVYISDPSWENHRQIFSRAGFKVSTYPYYDADTKGVDVDAMLTAIRQAPHGSIIVLHACCHNPTGYDLDSAQWGQLIEVIVDAGHLPFVDMAYQGFAKGIDDDAAVIRRFLDTGIEFAVSTSFSKSLSLYGQRVGAFHIVGHDPDAAKRSLSQIKICIRANYSNPPRFGAELAAHVLQDPELRADWESELAQMRERIHSLRARLVAELTSRGVDDMGFIAQQRGMFSYCGLTKEQMQRLRAEHAIYGTDSGRICVAALNDANLSQVAEAIVAVR